MPVDQQDQTTENKKSSKKCAHVVAERGATSLPIEHRRLVDILLGRPTTDGKYEASVPSEPVLLQIDKSDVDCLLKLSAESRSKTNVASSETPSRNKRDTGWINIFHKYISKVNESCVFMYKGHHYSTSKSIKSSNDKQFIISTDAKCSFTECTCSFHAIIYSNGCLNVEFQGSIRHSPSEQRSRPIRGTSRRLIADKLTSGSSPDQLRLKELGNLTDDNRKFGNYNLVGASPHVFRKIRSEAKTALMLDKDLSVSLEKIKQEQAQEINPGKVIPGHLQTISISPLRLILFTDGGLYLWKKLGNSVPVSWDATGGIIMSRGKKVFYYELSIANISPKAITTKNKSGPSFPVTIMLSNSHTTLDLVHWLQDFETAYRKVNGYNALFPKPPIIHSDGALVFQMSALRVFNGDLTIGTYLKRCWLIVNRTATIDDLAKTLVHSCLAHFVKNLKHQAGKHYPKQKVNIILYYLYVMYISITSRCHFLYGLCLY